MDQQAEQQQLEQEQIMLEQYLQHPVTLEFLRSVDESTEALSATVFDRPVTNIETFLAREQAFGEVRRLRWIKAVLIGSLEEVKERLKEIRV